MCNARYNEIEIYNVSHKLTICKIMIKLYKLFVFLLGYYKQVDETAQTIDNNGWLHTGDVGFIDDEENVFIVDRIKELIKYKGFQVSLF